VSLFSYNTRHSTFDRNRVKVDFSVVVFRDKNKRNRSEGYKNSNKKQKMFENRARAHVHDKRIRVHAYVRLCTKYLIIIWYHLS